MRPLSRLQRLFCTEPLSAGEAFEALVQQAHYLLHVLRMKDGGEVLLFNGRDGEWLAEVRPEGRKRLLLVPLRQTRPQPPASSLLFCFAPLKTGRLDYLVQKATEMGAGSLQPVLTQHTQQPRLPLDRLRANVIEAAEQCGILSVPVLNGMIRLQDLLAGWEAERSLIFCDEAAEAQNPTCVLREMRGKMAGILIGPEGGFSKEEREMLLALPYVSAISLGPRILRADTAAVAALAVFQAAAGDW